MEDLAELKQDVKEIRSDLKLISETLIRNTASLEVHERRTTLAERRLDQFESNSKWVLGFIVSGLIATLVRLLFH